MPEGNGSHLSIGEVLGLLLEEFPDVTISKIRFLESQGLIEPERTPSGYRKFFADDVELLRVILREQREHFLPLRVIKDRIDSGQLDPSRDGPVADDPAPPIGDDSPAPPADDTAAGRLPFEQPTRASVAGHPAAGRRARPAAGSPTGAGSGDDSDEPAFASAARLLPGVLVNRDELCAMASITATDLAQLEEYGVIARRGSVHDLYDDDAVAIAAIAGSFTRAGVDARHLRAWRTSAEREAGLYEQLILPLLRQRNPQSRQHAAIRLDELNTLGGRLRTAMMRSALRRHLDA